MHVGTNSHTKFNRRRNSNTSNKNEHFLKKRWISGFLGLAGMYMYMYMCICMYVYVCIRISYIYISCIHICIALQNQHSDDLGVSESEQKKPRPLVAILWDND